MHIPKVGQKKEQEHRADDRSTKGFVWGSFPKGILAKAGSVVCRNTRTINIYQMIGLLDTGILFLGKEEAQLSLRLPSRVQTGPQPLRFLVAYHTTECSNPQAQTGGGGQLALERGHG